MVHLCDIVIWCYERFKLLYFLFVDIHSKNRVETSACFKLATETVIFQESKGKVFYDQVPPSGESITTECEVNYQLITVIN